MDSSIKFTSEEIKKNNSLAFLDHGSLKIEVYRKPAHTDHYLLFDSRYPQEHKLGVIITLHRQAENLPTTTESEDKRHKHLRKALKPSHYPNFALIETVKI